MVSTFTTNKHIEKPGNGDYVDTWNVPVNADMNVIDAAFGTTISFNGTSGSQTLTSGVSDTYSYIPFSIKVTGALSANVVYTIPTGVGGQWVVLNTTTDTPSTGPWTVRFASGGGGTSVIVSRNNPTTIYSDGTNIRTVGSIPSGLISMWSGSIATIPSGWYLCDGTNGTPDLRNRFIVGAGSTYNPAVTGGSADATLVAHSHSATVNDPGHSHAFPAGVAIAQAGSALNLSGPPANDAIYGTNAAFTGIGVTISSAGGSATNANLPPYYALAYIMKA